MESILKSLQKALDILETFSTVKGGLGVSELSRSLGMNATSVYRVLNTLRNRGYLEQDTPKGKYRLGIKVFELGCIFQSQTYLVEVAMPHLERLEGLSKETVNLAILDENQKEVIYIAKIDSREILKTDIKIGTRLPANCTALGKVMLSTFSTERINELYHGHGGMTKLTENSVASLGEFKRIMDEVRKRGYAIDNEEFKIGVRCVAAAVLGGSERALAAVSIAGPASRLSEEKLQKFSAPLIKAAEEISRRLGYIPKRL